MLFEMMKYIDYIMNDYAEIARKTNYMLTSFANEIAKEIKDSDIQKEETVCQNINHSIDSISNDLKVYKEYLGQLAERYAPVPDCPKFFV